MFDLAKRYRSAGVGRVYVYNFTGAGCSARFDAGLTNPDGTAPADELPPLGVRSHGGPTGRASPALNLQIQFWTSRETIRMPAHHPRKTRTKMSRPIRRPTPSSRSTRWSTSRSAG